MTVQFIRTTHENGRYRHFPPQATRFWRQYGAVVGFLLRLEMPLSFNQLMEACYDYAMEHVEDGPQPELHEKYVAWVLIHLIEFGMVTAVEVPSTALATPEAQGIVYHIQRQE